MSASTAHAPLKLHARPPTLLSSCWRRYWFVVVLSRVVHRVRAGSRILFAELITWHGHRAPPSEDLEGIKTARQTWGGLSAWAFAAVRGGGVEGGGAEGGVGG
jgi:hypothetical protein